MSDLLGIGASGISAYSAALAVTGENVANAQTDGYSRRSVAIQSTGAGGANGLYGATIGLGGAQAGTVTRAWDQYRQNDALSATADDGRTSAAATWVDSAGDALGDGDTGLGAQVTAVFTAASTLAADPTSTTARSQMVSALGTAATGISGAATQLAKVSSGIDTAATSAVAGVNDDLSALAKLNTAMAATTDGTDAKASLADQRDQLLSDLSGKLGVTATIAANGTVSLTPATALVAAVSMPLDTLASWVAAPLIHELSTAFGRLFRAGSPHARG